MTSDCTGSIARTSFGVVPSHTQQQFLLGPSPPGPTQFMNIRPVQAIGSGTGIVPRKGRKVSLAAFGMPSSSPEDDEASPMHRPSCRSSTFSSPSPLPPSRPHAIAYRTHPPAWPWEEVGEGEGVTQDFQPTWTDWHRRVSIASSLWSESDLASGDMTSRRETRISLLSLTLSPQEGSEIGSVEEGFWMAQELEEEEKEEARPVAEVRRPQTAM
ncbi:hypothetical protein BJ684DRAFT_21047 [Piptocephalis cylindrospora]|uniref:Uncharacterized protein n=1 Tax=Piptocephalis cylindrospora TaxID=1907219 RepID=A0A4P9Y2V7_9FUNG|nr:hypothetical protein BJ684DRAFT_21047 [Piptocephalis cylindrospora]|eukprot:RKP12411.1 hypothetical protein BJ684DRAFT_21047 [Piptocephalis cylindrospora]